MVRHALSWMLSVMVSLCLFSVAVANQDEPETQSVNLMSTINQPVCSRPGTFTPPNSEEPSYSGDDSDCLTVSSAGSDSISPMNDQLYPGDCGQ
jgi:hypothetical protein